tara:strand:- start:50 stop:457 length:408 start_codon:yes stop_codon:yes gene_type:complete
MPRRKKPKRRRRAKTVSLLNTLEAYTYATILTESILGNSPYGVITGVTDLTQKSVGMGDLAITTGGGSLSLGDIATEPGLALSIMQTNFRANLVPMSIAAFTTSFAFRVGKKILRKPIANINRNIMRPIGAGIRL